MSRSADQELSRCVLDAAGRTHQGLVRPSHEDSLWCGTRVFAVADGVGGHPAGDVASTLVLEPLVALDAGDDPDDVVAASLADAVRDGNRRVVDDAADNPDRAGMGTTVTAAALAGRDLHLAHVGDSRAYRWRPGHGLEQLTADHTPVEEAVQAGELTREEAETLPQRHTLTRAIGLDDHVQVDAPDPVALASGERLLLCTDGLNEGVSAEAIADILERSDDAEAAADALIQAALSGGAPDNVTVVVVTAA